MSDLEKRLQGGIKLAAKFPSAIPGKLTWVGIHPLNPKKRDLLPLLRRFRVDLPKECDVVFRIRKFDIDESIKTGEVWVGEDSFENKEDYFAFDVESVIVQLIKLGIRVETLKPERETDYPI